MKLNSSVVIYGTRVILVPYEREHVPKYHEWMKDQEILEATASEPLSLEKEFEMQKSWREDQDKLTFILLSAQMIEDGKTELEAMIGDVNLFLNDPEDDQAGEVEVMIAEKSARQKGAATEALKLMMGYCYDSIHISRFVAKIGKHNLKSYSLFKNKLKFKYESESEIFEEFTMELMMDDRGRKVINVPFQILKRNRNWATDGQKPYLPPETSEIMPDDVIDDEKPAAEPTEAESEKLFLGLDEDDEDESGAKEPGEKKRKLHFGGLNFKRKTEEKKDPSVDFTADDCFDTW